MKKFIKRTVITTTSVIILLTITVFAFMQQAQFGKLPSGERLERIKKSPNFKNGSFQNLSHTPDLAEGVSYFKVMKEFIFDKSPRLEPKTVLPSKKIDLLSLPADENILVWFGHSSYFMQIDEKKFLSDPVFSGSASPVSFTGKSYKGSDVYSVEDFPEIDYLLISHDHYDHLDYQTITKLKSKVKNVVVGLGVGAHFEHWGYDPKMIFEKDWNEEISIEGGFSITVTPTRHFSGRGFKRNQSLWASYVLKTPTMKIYIGGDSGYDSHFATIGQNHGPFDLALLECGQYNQNWKYIHMMPEEVVQAAKDLKAKRLMPVHWSKFSLAQHAWDDPIIRVTAEAKQKNMPILHPLIGEKVNLQDSVSHSSWWEKVQ